MTTKKLSEFFDEEFEANTFYDEATDQVTIIDPEYDYEPVNRQQKVDR